MYAQITGTFSPRGDEPGYQKVSDCPTSVTQSRRCAGVTDLSHMPQAFNACAALLKDAQLSYLDLLLVQQGGGTEDRLDVWRGIQTLVSMVHRHPHCRCCCPATSYPILRNTVIYQGNVRSIGICDYELYEIEQVARFAIPLVCSIDPLNVDTS